MMEGHQTFSLWPPLATASVTLLSLSGTVRLGEYMTTQKLTRTLDSDPSRLLLTLTPGRADPSTENLGLGWEGFRLY